MCAPSRGVSGEGAGATESALSAILLTVLVADKVKRQRETGEGGNKL